MLADGATYKDGKLELFTINVKYCISFDIKGGILGIKNFLRFYFVFCKICTIFAAVNILSFID